MALPELCEIHSGLSSGRQIDTTPQEWARVIRFPMLTPDEVRLMIEGGSTLKTASELLHRRIPALAASTIDNKTRPFRS